MKKVFFSLAVLATVALVSCGGKKDDKACDSTCDSTEIIAAEATDTLTNDSTKDTAIITEAAIEETTPAAPEEEKK